MQLQQVEIHQPWVLRQPRRLVLSVIAVGQPAVVPVMIAFAVDRPVPGRLLVQHDLTVGVERRGECAGAGNPSVEVAVGPRLYRGMHVAVGGIQLELLLDDRSQTGLEFHGPRRLRIVAPRPGSPPLAVRQSGDQVLVPELVHRCKIRVVVVDAVTKPQGSDLAGVFGLSRVAAFAGRRSRAERKTLAAVPPAGLVVRQCDLVHAMTCHTLPQRVIPLSVAGCMRAPHPLARHVHPRGFRIGDVRQNLLETRRNGQEQPLEAIVSPSISPGTIAGAAVVRDAVRFDRVLEPQLRSIAPRMVDQPHHE